MRRDLLQWEQALNLASRLAPGETPTISREYGQQLEFTGDYPAALQHYERALLPTLSGAEEEEHNTSCRAGIARMALRCGDVRKGLAMCREVESRQLLRECADILEAMKQLGEAAQLYEAAQYHDKAAHLYIKLKNWTKVKIPPKRTIFGIMDSSSQHVNSMVFPGGEHLASDHEPQDPASVRQGQGG